MKTYDGESTTIQQVIDRLEKEKNELEIKLKKALLAEGKAYQCKRCQKVVPLKDASPASKEEQLCSSCWQIEWIDRQAKEIEQLESGIITEITTDGFDTTLIREIKIFRNNKIYRLGAHGEYDNDARIELLDKEKATEKPPVDVKLRPGQKKRTERPLTGSWATAVKKGGSKA